MLTLNDGRAELWQWDTGRTLNVDADCSQVHFSNKVFGRSIDVDVADGVAIIPDILLQTDKDLNVWAFVGTAENGYTKISKTFKVNRRNKPADYVFTPQEQILLKDAIATAEMAKIAANDAIESAKQAKESSTKADKSADSAASSAADAGAMASRAADSAGDAARSEQNAASSATQAVQSADKAASSANTASTKADEAAASANTAATKAEDAADSADAAAKSQQSAAIDAKTASDAKVAAAGSAEVAAGSANAAENSASAAAGSEQAAVTSELKAAKSEKAAKASEQAAAESAQAALESKTAAATSEANAAASAKKAQDVADSLPEDYTTTVNDIATLKQQVANITPDDSTVGEKPWTSKKIVDSLCMPFEESGNPVQCYPVENYPLGVKVSLEPVQEGSGDPSPENIRPITGRDAVSVTRCGKNLLDLDIDTFNQTGFWDKGKIISPYLNRIKFKPNTQYTISLNATLLEGSNAVAYLMIFYTDGTSTMYDDSVVVDARIGKDGTNVITSHKGKSIKRMRYVPGVSGPFTLNSIQIEEGATPTTYEQYNGDTYNIALPETVYGGTLDVESGVVTVDLAIDVKASGDIRESADGKEFVIRAKYNSKIVYHILCNCINGFSHVGKYYRVVKSVVGYETLTELQEALGDTLIQICYKLETPYTIQLTPKQIAALSGVNTIYTDVDGVIVSGAEDPKHTITELKNAIISLGGNV